MNGAPGPGSGLTSRDIGRGLRLSIVEGVFANGHLALTGGMFLTGLALFLGASPFQMGLLAAVPALTASFGFLSTLLVRRIGSRRKLVVWTGGLGKAVFIALVPFLATRSRVGLGLFFGVVVAYNVLMAVANTTWNSWMSDLVPEDRRGRFLGLRNAVLGGVVMLLTYGAGRFMDRLEPADLELGYALAFGAAVLLGIIASVMLAYQPEPALVSRPRVPLRERLLGPLLEEPQFRRMMIFLGAWFLTGTMASPFYMAHLLTNLEFSFAHVGVYAVLGGTTGLLFQLLWGWLIDRFGPKPVTLVCFGLVGFMPLLWIVATPAFRLPIWIDGVLNGVAWTGANLGMLNMILGLGDNPVRKESYFATFSVVVGLATFAASLAGGVIAQALQGLSGNVFGVRLVNYHPLFLVTGLARFACLPLLVRVQERRSRRVVRTLRVLGSFALRRLGYGKGVFLQALRARSRG